MKLRVLDAIATSWRPALTFYRVFETAVQALKHGACHYITKDFDYDRCSRWCATPTGAPAQTSGTTSAVT